MSGTEMALWTWFDFATDTIEADRSKPHRSSSMSTEVICVGGCVLQASCTLVLKH